MSAAPQIVAPLRSELAELALQSQPPASLARARAAVVEAGTKLLWGSASIAILLTAWQALTLATGGNLPTPMSVGLTLVSLLRDPFNPDRSSLGIGLQIGESLRRVSIGFALGSAVAIPLGILMGANRTAERLLNPIAQVLRPVSPLVWFPLALVAFRGLGGTATATLFTVMITSLWPTAINTAFGVRSIPDDYRKVARVFQFSRLRYLTQVLLPFVLPHILTGLRVSMGIGWLVIVAAEMLSGGIGIGFFAWDSYNAGSYDRMVAAVILIGVVGLVLDWGFEWALRRVEYR